MRDENEVTLCLDQITEKFPIYPLQSVEDDIRKAYMSSGGINDLPKLLSSIGGKDLRYHPKTKFQLPSGLAIFESQFVNTNGGNGVVGGPHEVFLTVHQNFNSTMSTFFSDQFNNLRVS